MSISNMQSLSAGATPTFASRLGTNYNLPAGATYDILLIGFPDGFPNSMLTFEIGDDPKKITGIQKVAQIFLKILFTDIGSNVLYPNQGTNFQRLTVNANVVSNDTVFTAELVSEINSAVSQTKGILNGASTDLASQLQSVDIIGMDVSQEAVLMYLRLTTVAGAFAQVAIPFPQLDMPLNGNN